MRLAITISHFRASEGGAESMAVSVVRGLVAAGHKILVVAEDGQADCGAGVHHCSLSSAEAPISQFSPDLVLDWGLNVPADAHRLGGGIHNQFLQISQEGRPLPVKLFKRIEQLISTKHRRILANEKRLLTSPQSRFLAVSNFVAEQLKTAFPEAGHRTDILHNGVDIERFSPDRSDELRDETRQELGLAPEDVVCLIVGHNLALKNFSLARRAVASLQAECPGLRLLLLGKRPPIFPDDWFIYAGQSPRPERYYAAADILLHPTYYDACANVVLEALASGLPVISSDRNGSAELIEDGSSGFVRPVVPDSKIILGEWCGLVQKLYQRPQLREKIGHCARVSMREYSFDKYLTRLEIWLLKIAELRLKDYS